MKTKKNKLIGSRELSKQIIKIQEILNINKLEANKKLNIFLCDCLLNIYVFFLFV